MFRGIRRAWRGSHNYYYNNAAASNSNNNHNDDDDTTNNDNTTTTANSNSNSNSNNTVVVVRQRRNAKHATVLSHSMHHHHHPPFKRDHHDIPRHPNNNGASGGLGDVPNHQSNSRKNEKWETEDADADGDTTATKKKKKIKNKTPRNPETSNNNKSRRNHTLITACVVRRARNPLNDDDHRFYDDDDDNDNEEKLTLQQQKQQRQNEEDQCDDKKKAQVKSQSSGTMPKQQQPQCVGPSRTASTLECEEDSNSRSSLPPPPQPRRLQPQQQHCHFPRPKEEEEQEDTSLMDNKRRKNTQLQLVVKAQTASETNVVPAASGDFNVGAAPVDAAVATPSELEMGEQDPGVVVEGGGGGSREDVQSSSMSSLVAATEVTTIIVKDEGDQQEVGDGRMIALDNTHQDYEYNRPPVSAGVEGASSLSPSSSYSGMWGTMRNACPEWMTQRVSVGGSSSGLGVTANGSNALVMTTTASSTTSTTSLSLVGATFLSSTCNDDAHSLQYSHPSSNSLGYYNNHHNHYSQHDGNSHVPVGSVTTGPLQWSFRELLDKSGGDDDEDDATMNDDDGGDQVPFTNHENMPRTAGKLPEEMIVHQAQQQQQHGSNSFPLTWSASTTKGSSGMAVVSNSTTKLPGNHHHHSLHLNHRRYSFGSYGSSEDGGMTMDPSILSTASSLTADDLFFVLTPTTTPESSPSMAATTTTATTTVATLPLAMWDEDPSRCSTGGAAIEGGGSNSTNTSNSGLPMPSAAPTIPPLLNDSLLGWMPRRGGGDDHANDDDHDDDGDEEVSPPSPLHSKTWPATASAVAVPRDSKMHDNGHDTDDDDEEEDTDIALSWIGGRRVSTGSRAAVDSSTSHQSSAGLRERSLWTGAANNNKRKNDKITTTMSSRHDPDPTDGNNKGDGLCLSAVQNHNSESDSNLPMWTPTTTTTPSSSQVHRLKAKARLETFDKNEVLSFWDEISSASSSQFSSSVLLVQQQQSPSSLSRTIVGPPPRTPTPTTDHEKKMDKKDDEKQDSHGNDEDEAEHCQQQQEQQQQNTKVVDIQEDENRNGTVQVVAPTLSRNDDNDASSSSSSSTSSVFTTPEESPQAPKCNNEFVTTTGGAKKINDTLSSSFKCDELIPSNSTLSSFTVELPSTSIRSSVVRGRFQATETAAAAEEEEELSESSPAVSYLRTRRDSIPSTIHVEEGGQGDDDGSRNTLSITDTAGGESSPQQQPPLSAPERQPRRGLTSYFLRLARPKPQSIPTTTQSDSAHVRRGQEDNGKHIQARRREEGVESKPTYPHRFKTKTQWSGGGDGATLDRQADLVETATTSTGRKKKRRLWSITTGAATTLVSSHDSAVPAKSGHCDSTNTTSRERTRTLRLQLRQREQRREQQNQLDSDRGNAVYDHPVKDTSVYPSTDMPQHEPQHEQLLMNPSNHSRNSSMASSHSSSSLTFRILGVVEPPRHGDAAAHEKNRKEQESRKLSCSKEPMIHDSSVSCRSNPPPHEDAARPLSTTLSAQDLPDSMNKNKRMPRYSTPAIEQARLKKEAASGRASQAQSRSKARCNSFYQTQNDVGENVTWFVCVENSVEKNTPYIFLPVRGSNDNDAGNDDGDASESNGSDQQMSQEDYYVEGDANDQSPADIPGHALPLSPLVSTSPHTQPRFVRHTAVPSCSSSTSTTSNATTTTTTIHGLECVDGSKLRAKVFSGHRLKSIGTPDYGAAAAAVSRVPPPSQRSDNDDAGAQPLPRLGAPVLKKWVEFESLEAASNNNILQQFQEFGFFSPDDEDEDDVPFQPPTLGRMATAASSLVLTLQEGGGGDGGNKNQDPLQQSNSGGSQGLPSNYSYGQRSTPPLLSQTPSAILYHPKPYRSNNAALGIALEALEELEERKAQLRRRVRLANNDDVPTSSSYTSTSSSSSSSRRLTGIEAHWRVEL